MRTELSCDPVPRSPSGLGKKGQNVEEGALTLAEHCTETLLEASGAWAYKGARLAVRCAEAGHLLCAAALPGAVLALVCGCLPPAGEWPLIRRCHSPANHCFALSHPTYSAHASEQECLFN